ncbi:aminotransferase class I/II-fold pyridoxal phosphate-dependent enzyme [Phosphitispora fastidiosa]|uniref:aminotransferase class I/II-fold pyridoxal phosphate-dependent enzyme n=1 Tax=Phosphitispora fastidiosa TaxID=2837202 RepID=UPI001E5DB998|nr:aminotransferase class I/II-fold pyridoxal phosphate-dependent enzyme [Phosphitispora fastidiosa]MBU7007323.1 aminotransferase [Phosphitispora fastidiosa]
MIKWSDKLSATVKNIPPSGIRRFFDLVTETKGVISLGVGEPDFVTPWHVREACIYSLEKGYTMYTSNWGMLELREEIARSLYNNYKVKYEPSNEVLVTVGVSEAMDLALRSVVSFGDEVLIPEPCFVSYAPCTSLAGGVPVSIPTTEDNGFRVTAAQIEEKITPNTKALILSYPNNPTGATISREELMEIAKVVKKHDLLVISDEIYDELTYEGTHTCFASLPAMKSRTILLNGFSKAYAMTGWRLGYACGHPEVIAHMTKIHQYTIMCAPIMAQMAALEALQNGTDEMKKMVAEYDRRRRLVLKGLGEIGLSCFEPRGAFYAFPSIRNTGMSSEEFAEKLLVDGKVAIVPGNVFGANGEGHIRLSYAASVENLTEAIERMGKFISKSGLRSDDIAASG